jgi:peptide/nickel transport system substrate-binding protein
MSKKLLVFMFLVFVLLAGQTVMAVDFNQSPVLDEKVESGNLPGIEDRLPDQPFVVETGTQVPEKYLDYQIGEYGGTLNLAIVDAGVHELIINFGNSVLRAPGQTTEDPKPAIVSEYKHNEDYTEFEFKIREGLKWSDGVEVTTEDVRFTFENFYADENVAEQFPSMLKDPSGNPGQLEVIDKYRFKVKFSEEFGWFETQLLPLWKKCRQKLMKKA